MRLLIARSAIALTACLCTTAFAQNVNWTQASIFNLNRTDHTIGFFEASPGTGLTVLYGGTVAGTTTTDTWEFNGATWAQRFPAAAPGQRWSSAMAFDRVRRRLVLFGGHFSTNPLLGDTWEWDGTNWTPVSSGGPSGRCFHAMAFDATRQRVVLFGGTDATGRRADTWEWDGTNWTQRFPANSPSARDNHAMAFDLNRQRLVLFGGMSGAGFQNDTWEWDGTNWTNRTLPFGNPAAMSQHALAYDAARERTVLYGTGGFSFSEWDGTTWVLTNPAAVPGVPTVRQQVAFDERRARVVFAHGGFAGTWEHAPLFPATFASFGAGCPGTGGLVPAMAPSALGELPWINDSYVLRVSNLQPFVSQAVFLILGFSNTVHSSGVPLPLDLTPLGAPGCSFLTSGESTLGPVTKPALAPFVDFTLAVPNNLALRGMTLFVQAAVTDTVNALGLVGSNGGTMVVGQR